MKITNLLLFIAIVTLASCSSTSIEEETALYSIEESATPVRMSDNEMALLKMINEHRASVGASKLILDSTIYNYAALHNAYMIDQNSISHTNFDTRSQTVKVQTKAANVSENVARFFSSNNGVVNGWLNSPSHKKTLEGNFTHTVISISEDATGKKYYTQLFYNL